MISAAMMSGAAKFAESSRALVFEPEDVEVDLVAFGVFERVGWIVLPCRSEVPKMFLLLSGYACLTLAPFPNADLVVLDNPEVAYKRFLLYQGKQARG